MGRVVIRPGELRSLAQRFDVVADDVQRARRRLSREIPDLDPNDDDPGFETGRFRRRSNVILEALQRAADGLRWDATVMAQTADEGEVADAGRSYAGTLGVGWAPETIVHHWTEVLEQLHQVEGAAPVTSDDARPASLTADFSLPSPELGPGGLFLRASSRSSVASQRVFGRLAAMGRRLTPESDPDWGGVWDRITDAVSERPADPDGEQ